MRYFLIETEAYQGRYQYRYITDTFDKAMSKIQENPTHYTDWYDSKGTCRIVEIDEDFKIKNVYKITNGKLYQGDEN